MAVVTGLVDGGYTGQPFADSVRDMIGSMRFLDVKTDFAFKKLFGSEDSTDILIVFLNALLEYPPERAITALTIVDPY